MCANLFHRVIQCGLTALFDIVRCTYMCRAGCALHIMQGTLCKYLAAHCAHILLLHNMRGTFCTYLGAHCTHSEVGDDALIAMSWYRAHGNYDTWCGSCATILPHISSSDQLPARTPASDQTYQRRDDTCGFFNFLFRICQIVWCDENYD